MPFLPALALLAFSASNPSVLQDRPDLWEAVWSLGSWDLDSSDGSTTIEAPSHGVEVRPGALHGPVARAVLALPPRGGFTVEVQRDSSLDLTGSSWTRVDLWSGSPPTARAAAPIQPEDWTAATTPNGRILRLAIPWAEARATGIRLARSLHVRVRMTGDGVSALDRSLAAMVANPMGSRRFGDRPASHAAGRSAVGSGSVLPQGERCLVATVRASAPGNLSRDGMVRIDGAALAKRLGSLSGISFDQVAVSTGGRGAIPLLTDSVDPVVGQERIPIRRIDLDGDGAFDPEDRIEFYAQGPSYWMPEPALGPGIHSLVVHPWDLSHRYLVRLDAPEGSPELALAPRRPSTPRTVASTLRPVWGGRHQELEKEEAVESGASWYWKIAPGEGLSEDDLAHEATTELPGLASPEGYATVRLVDGVPGRHDTVLVAGRSSAYVASTDQAALWRTQALKAIGNRYRWKRGFGGSAAFESITIHYAYAPSVTDLHPFPAPLSGAFAIAIAGATERDTLVAVEKGVGARLVPLVDGYLRDSASTPDTWYVSAKASTLEDLFPWKSPSGPFQVAPDRFLSREEVDLLVVAPDSFLDLASEYARFRADPARARPFRTGIVRSEDLWLATGRGSQDPLAIRDFLVAVRRSWNPSHVLLLGGGHFDPRGVLGAAPGPIPIFENGHHATDAVLQYLDPGEANLSTRIRDIALGRIPARSRSEVRHWLDKLRAWEDPSRASWGPWRRNFLAVADDLQNPERKNLLDSGFLGTSGHTESSERILARVARMRPWLRVHKVYEMEYPPNAVREKPDAGRALLEELNAGVAAWQYVGHGGWDILSHERILDTQTALAQLRNASQPFFMIAGSCTVGRHDMAFARGLSEALVVAGGKGAVGAVSGTRKSFGPPNEDLLGNFWTHLFERRSGVPARTFGEALALADDEGGSEVYNLLGDPAMTMPSGGTPLAPTRTPRTLAALDTFLVQGRADAEYAIELRTRSTPTTAYFQLPGQGARFAQTYSLPGRTLLSQRSRSNAGTFSSVLKVPGRVPFGDSAILSIYAWDPATLRDSAWIDTAVLMSGVGTVVSSDREGPAIRILPCDSSWSAGRPFGRIAEVPLPFCLNILLDDSSGISSSDAPDEGVILSVPGTLEPWHPSQIGEGSDFSQAVVRLDLEPGVFQAGKTYPLQVFARDLMGNASTAALEIHPRADGEVDLYEVFNRPNPAKGGTTTFYFKLLATADSNGIVPSTVQASIRIHTISGKLVRILQTDLTEVGHPRPRAIWDLKDSFRNEVANGVYPYVVKLRVREPSGGNWRQVERRGVVAVSR